MDQNFKQLSLFPDDHIVQDPRPSISVTWNMHHGCTRVSPGCKHCYVFRRDAEYGIDTTKVHKTKSFNLPIRKYRMGEYKGLYKIPSGSTIYSCFSSDFFHPAADEWRDELWSMIKERSDCTFFMITKRPERIKKSLPADWNDGWENVHIACTCENQWTANHRLSVFLPLPIKHKSITHEPMLEKIDIRPFLKEFGKTIDSVSCGGESGPEARTCDYKWILDTHVQCVEYGIPFHYHQTGAKLIKNGKVYEIPREHQHEQAHKAGLNYGGGLEIPECLHSGCE